MKNYLTLLGAAVVLGSAVFAAIIFVPPQLTPASALTPSPAVPWTPPEKAGLYAAQLSDCAACHTAPGGAPFAGGFAIKSPLGTMFSSNITPSKTDGIGNWTLDEFRAALVDGVGKGGHYLYPAMPYENYRKLTEADIEAMYDYFMHQVVAVDKPAPQTDLGFPFNQRWGMRLWNFAALSPAGFTAQSLDAQLVRGKYLVDGPAHCGACHTPRNLIMAQSSVDDSSATYLTGGVVDGWSAPDLRGPHSAAQKWSADDLALYLTTGRNRFSSATGEMAMAIEHSLQYMSDEDAKAMALYLHSLGGKSAQNRAEPEEDRSVATAFRLDKASDATSKMLVSADPKMPLGARLYLDNCNACHLSDGRGAYEIFPSLVDNSLVNARETKGLITTILFGATVPSTPKRPEELKMPGFDYRLNDDDVAQLATFLRKGWGNDAGPVTAADVAAVRASHQAAH